MRKITSTFLIALLTFSIGAGTVAAKPKNEASGNGNGAITIPFWISGDTDPVGEWSCSGVYVQNKNHTRINSNCQIAAVGSYAGTYSGDSLSDLPGPLVSMGGGYLDEAIDATDNDQLGNMSWQIVVTPNNDGSGHVRVVATND